METAREALQDAMDAMAVESSMDKVLVGVALVRTYLHNMRLCFFAVPDLDRTFCKSNHSRAVCTTPSKRIQRAEAS